MIRFEGGPLNGQDMKQHEAKDVPPVLYVRRTGKTLVWSKVWSWFYEQEGIEFLATAERLDITTIYEYRLGADGVYRPTSG